MSEEARALPAPAISGPLITKPIPSSSERIPVVGIGTARRFDHTTQESQAELKEMLRLFPDRGGNVIDTAESYGEPLVGQLISKLGNRKRLFLAQKSELAGTAALAAGRRASPRSSARSSACERTKST